MAISSGVRGRADGPGDDGTATPFAPAVACQMATTAPSIIPAFTSFLILLLYCGPLRELPSGARLPGARSMRLAPHGRVYDVLTIV
jgi:hypothetical protein